jgi:hypothetical protein
MAKKIEGHVSLQHADDGFTGDLWMVDSTVTTNAHPRGTLVIHEGKPERVFTESEVRAMLEDVAHCITWPMAKQVLKEKHGFELVPNE